VAKELGKGYLLESCRNGGSRFYERGFALNGFGQLAKDLSAVLSNLTGRDVTSLTLQSWRDIFPATELLRKYKAWCPICLEERKNNHQPIYEPLIWMVKAVNICEIHNVYLNSRCPLCDSEIPIISRKSRNGYCSYCGCWLGSLSVRYLDNEYDSWNHFVVSNIGNLLIGGACLPSNHFIEFINKLIEASGGLGTFSRRFNIAKSSASEWRNGLHSPSLCIILKLYFSLGVNILPLNNNQNLNINIDKHNNIPSRKNIVRRKIDWINVKTTLIDKINNHSALSLQEVAAELNINSRLLYKHFPLLCKEISKNYTSYIESKKNKRIQYGCDEVRKAVMALRSFGEFPTRRAVEKLLPSPVTLRNKIFSAVWEELTNNRISEQ